MRASATDTAKQVQPGMAMKDVDQMLGGPGAPDAMDPNVRNYPTEDGNIIVLYRDGKVAEVRTTTDR